MRSRFQVTSGVRHLTALGVIRIVSCNLRPKLQVKPHGVARRSTNDQCIPVPMASKLVSVSVQYVAVTDYRHSEHTFHNLSETGIYENNWPIVRDLVDEIITVTEEEIIHATELLMTSSSSPWFPW